MTFSQKTSGKKAEKKTPYLQLFETHFGLTALTKNDATGAKNQLF